jgi:hypothetical protein
MKDTALGIIEDYLQLVRRHLPVSIAEDILDELRDYMVEAATEEGGGTLSPESAKRTVSRFGAPSEVAEEYRESMLLEDHDASPELVDGGARSSELAPPAEEGYGKPVSLIRGLFHLALVLMIWAVPTSLAAGIPMVLLLPFQALAFTVFIILRGLYLKIGGRKLSKASYSTWPRLQRLFTLPFGILPRGRKWMLFIDFLVTFFFLIFSLFAYAFYPAIPFLLVRLHYIRKRLTDLDPILFVRRDAIVEFLLVLTVNLGIGITFWTMFGWSYWFPNVMAAVYGFFISTYLLIRLAGMSHGFWFEKMKIEEPTKGDTVTSSKELEFPYEESIAVVASDKLFEDDEIKRERPVSFLDTVIKSISLSLIWVCTSIILSAVIMRGDPYLMPPLLILLGIQIAGTIGIHLGNVARVQDKGITLWMQDNSDWSFLRKFLTFPKGVFPEQSTTILRMDLVASFLIVASCVLVLISGIIYLTIGVILIYLAIFMTLRFVSLDHRWNNPMSGKYIPLEFLSTLLTLLFGNLMMSVVSSFGSPTSWGEYVYNFYPMEELLFTGWMLYSIYLLYSLVANGGKLWASKIEVKSEMPAEIVVEKEPKTKREPAPKTKTKADFGKLKQSYIQTLGMITALCFIIGITSSSIYIMNGSRIFDYYFGWNLAYVAALAVGSSLLVSFQFLWRFIRISRNPTRSIIGGRTRIESLVDGIIMISVLFFVYDGTNFMDEIILRYLEYNQNILGIYLLLGSFLIAFSYMALYLAPVIRLMGDLIGLSFGESSSANRAIIVSGGIFILSSAVVIGMFGSLIYSIIPIVLYVIMAPVIVQMVTSYIKLTDQYESNSPTSELGVLTKEETTESSESRVEESFTPPRQ